MIINIERLFITVEEMIVPRKTKRETNEVFHPMDANIIVRPKTNGSKNTPTSEIFKRDDISPQKMLQW